MSQPQAAPALTDRAAIRALCQRYGFTLSKGFGQNFIVNPGICPRMAQAAVPDKSWGVLEIGPGIGTLTQALCAAAGKVASIELDRRLYPVLAETMAGADNFTLIPGDALKLDLHALLRRQFPGMPVAVCANLPYYITSPLLMRLLEEKLPVENITVMVQREAAQRLCAAPGTRGAGAVSYAVDYYATARQLFTVQPGSFYPPPKVVSAVIQLCPRPQPPVQPPGGDEQGLFRLVRAAFAQRRKTAANAIAAGLGLPKAAVVQALTHSGLPAAARPEQLTLADFCTLQAALAAIGAAGPDEEGKLDEPLP